MGDDKKQCIYCDSEGPFTEEHVFPAGMGGDDRGYLLIDTVCGQCNYIFSKFETSLMRRSVIALARILLQPHGRRRGEPPEIETLETQVIDSNGLSVESGHNGSKIEILAQLILIDDRIETTATDEESLQDFLKSLSKLLIDEKLLVIQALTKNKPKLFEVSTYKLSGRDYEFQTKEVVAAPPKKGIWISYTGHLNKQNKPAPTRIFLRSKGGIVLKTHDSSAVGKILGSVKRTLPSILSGSKNTTTSEIQNPLVAMTSESWSGDCDKAIAKIGFNLLVHSIGKKSATDVAFKKIKSLILDNTAQLPFSLLPDSAEGKIKKDLFANIPKNNHCLLLLPLNISQSEVRILFVAVLYGSIGVWSTLAESAHPNLLLNPVYFLVNYLDNQITTLSIMEYTKSYHPIRMEEMRQAFNTQNHFGGMPFNPYDI
ncbi:HNH endonuclease [Pseudomonas aylmerensis]|uniref:HNH endonuclease n=1 Tax=Pseudomonas aylmerensis TaxID=1869229 RepID=UPI00114CBB06|nr:HNH endonuclease [Pseudomonas aylmerensis]